MALTVSNGTEAVKKAKSWLGTPYCWGGGHSGSVPVGTCVDCSGLVNQVYGTTGNTFTQVQMGAPVASIREAGPGDLVFFGPLAPGEPHHVGIYVGNNQMIDAPHTGTTVRRDSVSGFGTINAIRRLVPPGAGNGGDGTAAGPVFNYAQLEGIWIQAGGNAQAASMAAAIAMAESGGNANASNTNTNGSIDRGLWQINSTNGTMSSFDVMTNARAAVRMSNQGQTWRPWCTAYSDGACGSKGGVYLGPGAPYQKFLKQGVPPDMSVPINATNAAANQPAVQEASLDSALFGTDGPILCILKGPEHCFNAGASEGDKLIANSIKAIVHMVLNPIIQPIAGVMGITAGAVLMLGGSWILVSGTRAGQGVAGTGKTAARIFFPQLGIGMGATERTAYRTQQTAQMRIAGRERLSAQEATQREQAAGVAYERRMEAMSTQQLLDLQAMAYKEWLMRTRPPRGGGGGPTPRQGPQPRAIRAKTGPARGRTRLT